MFLLELIHKDFLYCLLIYAHISFVKHQLAKLLTKLYLHIKYTY